MVFDNDTAKIGKFLFHNSDMVVQDQRDLFKICNPDQTWISAIGFVDNIRRLYPGEKLLSLFEVI